MFLFICLIVGLISPQLKIPLLNEFTRISQSFNESVIFPRFCVVGIASAGKSTLINFIVGYDIIPHGVHTCTRCPLQITLNYGEFLGEVILKNGSILKYKNPREIHDHINKVNNELAREGKFSDVPINLVLHTPNSRNMILVDLPGLISAGDDSRMIDKMVENVIKDPNTLILAVLSSEIVPENNKAWDLIKIADPDRKRTVGIYTKVNMIQSSDMDEKLRMLENSKNCSYHLKLGWYPVVLRPENMSLNQSLEYEKELLEKNEKFHQFKDIFGLKKVCSALSRVWEQKVYDSSPNITKQILRMRGKIRTQLEKCSGYLIPENEQFGVVLDYIQFFAEEYAKCIKPSKSDVKIVENEEYGRNLFGSALVLHTVSEEFSKKNYEKEFSLGKDTDEEFNLGVVNALAFPEHIFTLLCRSLIAGLRESSLLAINQTLEICKGMVIESLNSLNKEHELDVFPVLKDYLMDRSKDLLEIKGNETRNAIKQYFESELGYINIRHKRFNPAQIIVDVAREYKSENLFSWLKKQGHTTLSNEVNLNRFFLISRDMRKKVFERLVSSYYGIVQDTVVDVVPKTIMTHLLYSSRNQMQAYIRRKVKLEDGAYLLHANQSMIKECEETAKEDNALKDVLNSLEHLKESAMSLSMSPSSTLTKPSSSSSSSYTASPLQKENGSNADSEGSGETNGPTDTQAEDNATKAAHGEGLVKKIASTKSSSFWGSKK